MHSVFPALPPATTPTAEIGARDLRVLVVPHTHWDREWYRTAGEFRLALVALVDEVLAGRGRAHFLLDGQAIVLHDYLAVRPERRDDVVRALRDGRIEAGPWYVLADTLIPSGEALVRNLLAGRAALRALGATPPPVLYCPDSFGHAAALPVLAEGFGTPVLVVWRGFGGVRAPAGDVVRWRHASGAEALLFHLPPDGYEFGSSLPSDGTDAAMRWARLRDVLAPRSTLGILLVQNGADHHAVQDALPDAIGALARAAAPIPVAQASLGDVAALLRARASTRTLPVVDGELRDSTGHTWVLQGTFGTRAAQKRTNAALERLLVREAEPWSALARWCGARSRVAELHALWRLVLECHPHDTLCGCSIDAVAAAMDARLVEAARTAAKLSADAQLDLLGHDAVAAREAPGLWRHVVVVRNAAARPRGGVAELQVDVPLADVPVGPGSAGFSLQTSSSPDLVLGAGDIPMQLLSSHRDFSRVESPRHYPRNALVERRRLLAWLPGVAALSQQAWEVREGGGRRIAPPERVEVIEGELRNASLRVRVADGAVRLTSADGHTLVSAIGLEDVGERGDAYTHSPIPGSETRAVLVSHRVTMKGPLRAELTTRWRLTVPARDVTTATGEVQHRAASTLRLECRLQLDAGAPFVRVLVRGDNDACDHRLRLVVATELTAPSVWSDAAFGPVRRATTERLPAGDAAEARAATSPLHRYVSCFGATRGVTLYSDGLAEQEVRDDGRIAVTLLRALGDLSRHDLLERPGHAGWPASTPAAQSLGPFEGGFALFLHGPRTEATIDAIERTADDVLLPLTGASLRSALQLPEPTPSLRLDGEGLAFSSCADSEDGSALVARCVNLLDRPVAGRWRLAGIREAQRARLDGTPLGELAVVDDGVPFVAEPHAVVTILLRGGVTPHVDA